jgi:hypothetical protein
VSESSAAALTRRWNRLNKVPLCTVIRKRFLPRHGPVFGITLAPASVQLVLDTTCCVGITLLASRARRWLARAAIRHRLERILGATLVAPGIDLATRLPLGRPGRTQRKAGGHRRVNAAANC